MGILFEEELEIKAVFEAEGQKAEVIAVNIESIDLELFSYGYEGRIKFNTFDGDEIDQLFALEKVIELTLTFKSLEGEDLLETKGVVTSRLYKGEGKGKEIKKIRHYEVHFTDYAQASWGSHFPIAIFVEQTMKNVIDAQMNPLISMKYDLEALNEAHPILAFSLKEGETSFYSFLNWYLDQENGILQYHYDDHTYSILGKKSEEGEALEVGEWSVSSPVCFFPEPFRYSDRIVKHPPTNLDKQDKENPNGFKSMRKDVLDESFYIHHPEQVTKQAKTKKRPEKPEIFFAVKEFTEELQLENLLPGELVKFKENIKEGPQWCDDAVYKDKEFRIKAVSFRFENQMTPEGKKKTVAPYLLELFIKAEMKEETSIPRPLFSAPQYPFSILGRIGCGIGDKEQTTFNLAKDKKGAAHHYHVHVPLVEDGKTVIVPFFPDFTSGQAYFPLCKNQHVLLSVYFQTAKIERIIDWQPLVRLPAEEQANQIVFASNGKDKYCLQKHEFKDGKDSIFTIKQSSSETQTQTIQIQEKKITIVVEEKDKNTLTIAFDRDEGLTLQLEDKDASITQQTIYTKESITHSSKGDAGESFIVQKPDSISFECKTYTVKCEELLIDAEKTITGKGGSKVFIEAPLVNIKDTVKLG